MPEFGVSTPVSFSQGLADNPNVVAMKQGELILATGCEYRLGSLDTLYKTLGRTINATGVGSAVTGLKRFQYNDGTDVFVAVSAGKIYEATPGTSMTFTDIMNSVLFNGVGQDDLNTAADAGPYQYSGDDYGYYEVIIDSVGGGSGGVDTFKWRENRGAWTENVDLAVSPVTELSGGMNISWDLATGHTLGDEWILTSIPRFSTTKLPSFVSFRNTWMMTIDGRAYVREAANVPGTASPWRPAGMPKPGGQPTITLLTTAQAKALPDEVVGGDYVRLQSTLDGNPETSGYMRVDNVTTSATQSWSFSTNLTPVNIGRVFTITHTGLGPGKPTRKTNIGPQPNGEPPFSFNDSSYGSEFDTRGTWTLEFSIDSGTTWTLLHQHTGRGYSQRTDQVPLADSQDLTVDEFHIRQTLVHTQGEELKTSTSYMSVFTGRETPINILNAIWYGTTEVYTDSNDVEHESPITVISDPVVPGNDVDLYGANVDLSTINVISPYATKKRIYRSLDEGDGSGTKDGTSGGYPFMYQISEVDIDSVQYLDDFESYSLISALDKIKQLDFQNITFPDGAQTFIQSNIPPPKTSFVTEFQGSLVYVPQAAGQKDKLFYSEPFSIAAAGAEKVPDEYFIRFETPQQDGILNAIACNGGKSLIVYFNSTAALINYLPQASDPGRFDQRAKEKISKKRGTSGKLTATSFSPDEGITEFAASVDSIGLWVTDGIGTLLNWSKEIDWDTHFGSADLTTAVLADNPVMRRLELYYDSNSSGAWKLMKFFYGDVKANRLPKVTGPDDALIRSIEWAKLGDTWAGFTGGSSGGEIYNENTGTEDAAESNGSDTNILFFVKTKDYMPYKLRESGLFQFVYLLWDNATVAKDTSVQVSSTTEAGYQLQNVVKTYNVKNTNKMFVNIYGDRARLRVSDNSNTALPGLVGAELVTRRLGGSAESTAATAV